MKDLVYPRERVLGGMTLVLGLVFWLCLIAGTFGVALLALAAGFVVYLFAQSALIAHIKGNGVELSHAQFPDLHGHFLACCERLQIGLRPKAYVLNGNGSLNAFATRFLGTQYVVLFSEVADAMQAHPDGIRFYIGHELGHLRMKHLMGQLLRWPALWLPLLGAGYARARESTCDRHGAACCESAETGARALAALAAGSQRWRQVDLKSLHAQANHAAGFWMSFHELLSGYPWTTKRVARVMSPSNRGPARHPLSYLLASVVPYAGRLGGGFGLLLMVYIVGILAAVALPAYHDYTARAKFAATVLESQPAREALAGYYQARQSVPRSLDEAGIRPQLPSGNSLQLDADHMVLTVTTKAGDLVFTPTLDEHKRLIWRCAGGEGVKPGQLPQQCR